MLEERLKPLLGEYSNRGFELSEIDDQTIQLSFQGETIAIIGTLGLRSVRELAELVQDSCREHSKLLARAEGLARQTERLASECQSRRLYLNSLSGQAR